MTRSRLKNTLLSMCAVGALAAGHAGAASAATTIVSGGSSLAAIVYDNMFSTYSALVDPTATFTYSSVGSGGGQNGFFFNAVPNPVAGVTSWLTQTPARQGDFNTNLISVGTAVAIGASDATLTSSLVSAWQNSSTTAISGTTAPVVGYASSGRLIQVPTFGTPIAVSFKVTTQTSSGSIKLTDSQICGIFSGKITAWNDPALTGINAIGTQPTGPITVVTRLDNSGTTFLFTNHLKQVCVAADVPASFANGAGTDFGSNSNPNGSLPGGSVGNSSGQNFFGQFPANTYPTGNFTAQSGSGGVQAYIMAHPGSISYLSPDYTSLAAVNQGTNLPVVASVKNTHLGTYFLPSVTNTRNALATFTLPTDGNTFFIDWTPLVPDPTAGYPIVGFTTMETASCYVSSNVATSVVNFLAATYGANPSVVNQLSVNGFTSLPSSLANNIKGDILNPGAPHLINGAGVGQGCNGFPGRAS